MYTLFRKHRSIFHIYIYIYQEGTICGTISTGERCQACPQKFHVFTTPQTIVSEKKLKGTIEMTFPDLG